MLISVTDRPDLVKHESGCIEIDDAATLRLLKDAGIETLTGKYDARQMITRMLIIAKQCVKSPKKGGRSDKQRRLYRQAYVRIGALATTAVENDVTTITIERGSLPEES